jgi:hypothetical protein
MKALLKANSVTWSGSWLHALPLPYAGLTMTALEYRTALRFRTGHDVLSSIARCRFCASDTFGFRELSYPGQIRLLYRHNALHDCLYSLAQQAGDENLRICIRMERGINQRMFYLVHSIMVVICACM